MIPATLVAYNEREADEMIVRWRLLAGLRIRKLLIVDGDTKEKRAKVPAIECWLLVSSRVAAAWLVRGSNPPSGWPSTIVLEQGYRMSPTELLSLGRKGTLAFFSDPVKERLDLLQKLRSDAGLWIQISDRLEERRGAGARKIWEFILRHRRSASNVDDLAKMRGCSRRCLERTVARAGLQPPAQLLCVIRLADGLLSLSGSNYEAAALRAGYSSGRAFQVALSRRLPRESPSEEGVAHEDVSEIVLSGILR